MDSMALSKISKFNNFKLSWTDYFKVIDSLPPTTQKIYINRYIWYYHAEMNESIYKELIKKPYFKDLKSSKKVEFLNHYIRTDNTHNWVNKYFTEEELKQTLRKNSFYIFLANDIKNNNKAVEKEDQKIKNFYNYYENLMNPLVKERFFQQIIKSGRLNLIEYFYKHKNLRIENRIKILWTVGGDTAADNTQEILLLLRDLGVNFTQNDLIRIKKSGHWLYVDSKKEILYFLDYIKKEKAYIKLNNKFNTKRLINKEKLKKI